MGKFKGDIIHSCQYRRPQIYKGKKVLTLGGGTSGQDIADQISHYADKVYVNGRKFWIVFPDNMENAESENISHFTGTFYLFIFYSKLLPCIATIGITSIFIYQL